MAKFFLLAGSLSGSLSVAIGAFGAHALKKLLLANGRIDVFETAVRYQFYHSLALLLLGILVLYGGNEKLFAYAGYSFLAGIIIFSGSLYVLCLTNISRWGAVTPIGGLFLIAGWVFIFFGVLKMQQV